MYKKKIEDILNIIEKNHLCMYFNITKDQLSNYINDLFKQIEITNEYDFYYYTNATIKKIFDRFDSHTKLIWNNTDGNLPIRFKYLNNTLYIVETNTENSDLLYGKVIRIDHIEITKLIEEIKNMTAYSTEEYLASQIETILYNIHKLKSLPSIDIIKKEFEIEILKNNKTIRRVLTKCEGNIIKTKENYYYELLNDKIYIVYNKCNEDFEGQMKETIENIKSLANKNNINKFIVDIRGNMGGNSKIIDPLIEYLKDKNVITLVDKYVFSAGRFAIISLKNINSIFVGTGIGTTLNCFGNTATRIFYDNFIIPISDSYYYYDNENKSIIRANSIYEFNKIRNMNNFFSPQFFTPDYYVEKTIDNYINNDDNQLDFAINILDKK